jgi:hypothetical protein
MISQFIQSLEPSELDNRLAYILAVKDLPAREGKVFHALNQHFGSLDVQIDHFQHR